MKHFLLPVLTLLFVIPTIAQQRNVNQDESKVPVFQLPDVLRYANGEKVTSVAQWENTRRPELFNLFAQYIYLELKTTVLFKNLKI